MKKAIELNLYLENKDVKHLFTQYVWSYVSRNFLVLTMDDTPEEKKADTLYSRIIKSGAFNIKDTTLKDNKSLIEVHSPTIAPYVNLELSKYNLQTSSFRIIEALTSIGFTGSQIRKYGVRYRLFSIEQDDFYDNIYAVKDNYSEELLQKILNKIDEINGKNYKEDTSDIACDSEEVVESSKEDDYYYIIDFIKSNYGNLPVRDIAKHLNITIKKIEDILLNELDVPVADELHPMKNQFLSLLDKQFIKDKYTLKGWSISEISSHISKNPATVLAFIKSIDTAFEEQPSKNFIPTKVAEAYKKMESKAVKNLTNTVEFLEKQVWDLMNTKTRDLKLNLPTIITPQYTISNNVIFFNICDLHFFHRVDKGDINYVNAYNREIAIDRFQRFIQGAIHAIYKHKPKYVVISFQGDLYSGNIHLNNLRDGYSIVDTKLEVEQLLAWGITEISKHATIKTINFCSGNHGRYEKKDFDSKAMMHENMDYETGIRIRNLLSESLPDTVFNCHDTVWLAECIEGVGYILSHGHSIRGGNNMAGCPATTASREASKQSKVWVETLRVMTDEERNKHNPNLTKHCNFKHMIVGHFHSDFHIPGMTLSVHGGLSLMGADRFAINTLGLISHPGQTYYILNENGIIGHENIVVR